MTRREVLAGSLAATAIAARAQNRARLTKGICSVIFPRTQPRAECFVQARSAGFDAMEVAIGPDIALDASRDDVRRFADAADKAGIQIATLWASDPLLRNPVNSPD